MVEFLTQQEKEKLEKGHRTCKNKKHADRIKTILALNAGYSYAQIAELLLLDDSTLRRYHEQYIEGGIDALLEDGYTGGLSYLSLAQQQTLQEHLEKHFYKRAKDVCEWVNKRFGVLYTPEGMLVMLHKLGFVYKKTKLVPGKADPKKQKAFIADYRKLKATKGSRDKIYFMDGAHPLHNPVKSYGWIKKGTEKEIPSNTGRERVNLNGAYCVETGKVTVRKDDKIDSKSTILLFVMLMRGQPQGSVYIIADNARYYRSKMVKEFLDKHRRIKLIFLPPYSPNLNLQERIWRFMKEKILDKYHAHFKNFEKSIIEFFKNIEIYSDELETLMTENFQIIKPNFSQT